MTPKLVWDIYALYLNLSATIIFPSLAKMNGIPMPEGAKSY
jgi:hypothetical protein